MFTGPIRVTQPHQWLKNAFFEAIPLLISLIQLARPKHWIKNVFVVLPVPFAMKAASDMGAANHFEVMPFLLGLAGFCLLNSGVYTLNDLFDAKADALHPVKRNRPLPAGIVPTWVAGIEAIVLCTLGMTLSAASGKNGVMAISITYVSINIAYCLKARHVALLDVFLLSSGFLLRVLLGCALVSAHASGWLLLCTSSLALFLAFAKRRADIREGLNYDHRPSLRGYTLPFLDQAMVMCAGTAILSYALYSIEGKILLPSREMISMPFVAFGILSYLRVVDVEDAGGSPVDVVFHSVPLQICGAGWLAAVTWSLGPW